MFTDVKQMKTTPNAFGLGLGNQIFDDISFPSSVTKEAKDADHDDNADDDVSEAESDSLSSDESLITAMALAAVADSEWKCAPCYPPLYLSTASEYLPPQPKEKLHNARVADPTESDEKSGKDISWASEPYEDSLEMDHVFERFTKRVGYEGEQCVRSVDRYYEECLPNYPDGTIIPGTNLTVHLSHIHPTRSLTPFSPHRPRLHSLSQNLPSQLHARRSGHTLHH